ncbi:MAG TPA: AMP-binding protein [Candidatus Nesterenkonia stercoripullorum]|uniref:AMP-binding protein n=1 Tax=Candidatus Nesterenkonia stercoripullorum TaxID=2838701 RepID=A0A9D2A8R6_9MICC|nr:AMP-binding protein [Candidatus Nesterenkonia stercoripullorum]
MTRDATIAEAQAFIDGPSLSESLAQVATNDPGRVYLRDQGEPITAGELDHMVNHAVGTLREHGVTAESRVGLALQVGADHVVLIFALLRMGALWLPLNTQLKGEPLRYQLGDSGATHVITLMNGQLADELPWADRMHELGAMAQTAHRLGIAALTSGEDHRRNADRAQASLLMYTSGTTGPPKGVLVTEAMMKAAIFGAIEVTRPEPDDVFFVWEPLFHIGGAQVVFLPLYREIALALVPRFSASRFWDQVRESGATHIHYLGGVLQILLQLPESPSERDNHVRMAWGAGATPEVRSACQNRYGFELNECYGMTEASSVITVNRHEPEGGVGAPFPWVQIEIDPQSQDEPEDSQTGPDPDTAGLARQADDGGAAGTHGELIVRGLIDGMLTPGYLGKPEATAKARDGKWFRTGDYGYLDQRGNVHFTGRGSDSIRVRGENVSTWQVESVLGLHPDVGRCAVVGVKAEVGEQEMLLVMTEAEGRSLDPAEVLTWAAERLPAFQVPKYARVIAEMPLTPSQRIAKHRLSRELEGAVRG